MIAWWLVPIGLLVLYVGVLFALYRTQDRVIFFGHSYQGRARPDRLPHDARLLSLRTSEGTAVTALYSPGRSLRGGHPLPTLLFFYGNGGSIAGTVSIVDELNAGGFSVLMPDFVGYGMSEGLPSERGLYLTADAAYDALTGPLRVPANQILVCGWSLGGAVAIDLVARRPARGLVTFCTFTSMGDIARMQHRSVSPFVRFLLKSSFDSITKMPRVSCPVLIVHGDQDRFIPFAMADRLAEACRSGATRVTVSGAGHVDIFERNPAQVRDALHRFATIETDRPLVDPSHPSRTGPHL